MKKLFCNAYNGFLTIKLDDDFDSISINFNIQNKEIFKLELSSLIKLQMKDDQDRTTTYFFK